MSDAAYYRAEAARMLDWASHSLNPEIARRWKRLAEDYVLLADELEAKDAGRAPFFASRMQRQPVQQQQDKLGAEEGRSVLPSRRR